MKSFSIILVCLISSVFAQAQTDLYYPPTSASDWDTISFGDLNWCDEKLESLIDFLDSIDTKSFILLKDGKIVIEEYFESYTIDSTAAWYSAAKSFRSVLIGKAQEENYLRLNDKVSKYLGNGWTSLSPIQEDSISIWNLITMTSGLDESFFFCVNPICLKYISTAGMRWAYHNGPYSLTENILENATGKDQNAYSNTIENQIGMDGFWYNFLNNSTYISTARDMARFGLLIQGKGKWDQKTIISDTSYLNQMIKPSQSLNPSYGYLWWLNGQSHHVGTNNPTTINGPISPNAPSDIYLAAGANGQFISISPSLGLMMIRQGLSKNEDLTELDMHDNLWSRIVSLDCGKTNVRVDMNKSKFQVYPNPAKSIITIKYPMKEDYSFLIKNVYGETVMSSTLQCVNPEINIGNFVSGTYFLIIEDLGLSKLVIL